MRIDFGDPAAGANGPSPGGSPMAKIRAKKTPDLFDGLDVDMIAACMPLCGRVKVSFGWGTMLTNDFIGLSRRIGWPRSAWCVQGGVSERQPTVEAVGQSVEGHGPQGRNRALQARVRRGRDGSARGRV